MYKKKILISFIMFFILSIMSCSKQVELEKYEVDEFDNTPIDLTRTGQYYNNYNLYSLYQDKTKELFSNIDDSTHNECPYVLLLDISFSDVLTGSSHPLNKTCINYYESTSDDYPSILHTIFSIRNREFRKRCGTTSDLAANYVMIPIIKDSEDYVITFKHFHFSNLDIEPKDNNIMFLLNYYTQNKIHYLTNIYVNDQLVGKVIFHTYNGITGNNYIEDLFINHARLVSTKLFKKYNDYYTDSASIVFGEDHLY